MAPLTPAKVRTIFAGVAAGKGPETMAYVADNVKWTVTNPNAEYKSHPLAGLYNTKKSFMEATFAPLGQKLTEQLCLRLDHEPIVNSSGDTAVVELRATDPNGNILIGKNGVKFDNRYAWILKWDEKEEKIVEVRAYLDSAMVRDLTAG